MKESNIKGAVGWGRNKVGRLLEVKKLWARGKIIKFRGNGKMTVCPWEYISFQNMERNTKALNHTIPL